MDSGRSGFGQMVGPGVGDAVAPQAVEGSMSLTDEAVGDGDAIPPHPVSAATVRAKPRPTGTRRRFEPAMTRP
jgi:hypothetical protein